MPIGLLASFSLSYSANVTQALRNVRLRACARDAWGVCMQSEHAFVCAGGDSSLPAETHAPSAEPERNAASSYPVSGSEDGGLFAACGIRISSMHSTFTTYLSEPLIAINQGTVYHESIRTGQ